MNHVKQMWLMLKMGRNTEIYLFHLLARIARSALSNIRLNMQFIPRNINWLTYYK